MATRKRLDEVMQSPYQRDFEYQESLAPKQIDLGKIDVKKRFQPTSSSENSGMMKEIGRGLAKFMQSTGQSMAGKPIDITGQAGEKLGQRGWESYLGANIGAKLGAGLIGSALFGSETGSKLGAAAEPTLYNTPEQQWLLQQQRATKGIATPSAMIALQRYANQKQGIINMIKSRTMLYPDTNQVSNVDNEKDMRGLISGLSLKFPGIDPNDPEIDMAIKTAYANQPKGFFEGIFSRKPKTAKGRMVLQQALDEGISEDEALDYVTRLEEGQ